MGRLKYDREAIEDLTMRVAASAARGIEAASVEEIAAGKGWYFAAWETARLVGEYAGWKGNRAIERGAGAIAVLSPRVRWERNTDDAFAIATDNYDWEPTAFGTNVKKAMVILAHDVTDSEALEEISGPKVTAFYDNIRRPAQSNAVVVDTHMCKMFDIPGRDIELKGVYDAVAEGIRTAAYAYRMRPHQAQAIGWIQTRGPQKEDLTQ